jgi:hypothetical protein
MKNLTIILLISIVAFSLNAQQNYNPEVLERNNIKQIEGYIFEGNSETDSFLLTNEYFNSRGRRTKIEIHDSLGLRSEYIYFYKNDTLRTERITKFDGRFSSRTKIFYDKKFREVKAIDFDIKNKKTGTYSKIKYKDSNLTEEHKIYFSNKLAIHSIRQYDENKSLKLYLVKKKGRWENQLNAKRLIKTEIENYQNTGLKLKRTEELVDRNKTILGIKGKLILKLGDVLITEEFLNKKGLIEYEKQYLNGNLIATKKYKFRS